MTTSATLRAPCAIRVADEATCAAACCEIYAQRPRWAMRRFNGKPPFYTLGNAAYADLDFMKMPLDAYLAGAGSVSAWAGEAVRALLNGVCAALARYLGAPAQLASALPEPGFHLFIGAAIPRTDCLRNAPDCGSSHFDLQYRCIPWERWYADVDTESTISFTLPLRLPSAGGGLTVWDQLDVPALRALIANGTFPSVAAAAHATPARTIPYEVGSLVVHSGRVLHQIAGVRRAAITDERITLQGHGILCDGGWRLYW